MPPKSSPASGLVDTWGRKNRLLEDKKCEVCGKLYRPNKRTSRFCSRPCLWSQNGGYTPRSEGPCWWKKTKAGYICGRMWVDGRRINIRQHRWVVEGILGRSLEAWEDVHHKNGVKDDNRPSNLVVLAHGEHSRQTNANREYRRGYKMKLSNRERERRSMAAVKIRLPELGRAAIARAESGGVG